MLIILSAVVELQRAKIREWQAEGIALAKERGVYSKPRTPEISPSEIEEARERVKLGVSKKRIAEDLGVSRIILYHALERTGRYKKRQTNFRGC